MSARTDWVPPVVDASPDETAPRRRGPIVVHQVVYAGLEQLFPELDLVPGRALCGFVFTASNRVSMTDRASEGEQQCGRCEAVYLGMLFELD